MAGQEVFLGNVQEFLPLENLAVFLQEEIRLFRREKIVVALAKEFVLGNAHQLFAGPVAAHEAQVFGLLEKEHVGDVVDDGI